MSQKNNIKTEMSKLIKQKVKLKQQTLNKKQTAGKKKESIIK